MLRAPTHDELIRPRLTARFQAAARDRVVLVVAPAGYGKSIALRQYLEQTGDPAIRFNVRAEHGTLLGFVRGFADAFSHTAPALAQTLVQTFSALQAADNPGAQLAEWAQQHIEEYEGIVAIDDMHLAQDEPQIIEFLKHLVRHCASIQWLVCTRTSAGLPLGEWGIAGYMTVPVDEHDLRFTPEEAVEVSRVLGAATDEDAVNELVNLTRGWPTALAFALRSAVHAGDVRKLAAATRDVMYRYLSEHVYDSLTSRQQELLRFIAFAPAIDLGVLECGGFPDARKVLEELRTRVTFISDDARSSYRCHDLFIEFLQQRIARDGSDAVLRTRLDVAAALECKDDIVEALRQYTVAQAEKDIVRLLSSHGLDLLETGYTDAIDEAIGALAPQIRDKSAIALALRGIREARRGRFDRAEDLLRQSLANSSEPSAIVAIGLRLAIVMLNGGCDPRPLLASLESTASDRVSQAEAFSLLAAAHGRFEDSESAYKYVARTKRLLSSIEDGAPLAKIYSRLAVAALDLEMPYEDVSALALAAERLAIKFGLEIIAGNVYAMLGNSALYYFEDIEILPEYERKIRACAGDDQLLRRQVLLWEVLRLCYSGDESAAKVIADELKRCKTSDVVRTSLELPLHAMIFAWNDRLEEASAALNKLIEEGRLIFSWDRGFWASVCAVLYAAIGNSEGARHSIAIAREPITTKYTLTLKQRAVERTAIFCAIAEVLLGRMTAAERLLNRTKPSDAKSAAFHHLAATLLTQVRGRYAGVSAALEALSGAGCNGFGKMLRAALKRHGSLEPVRDAPNLTKTELSVLTALAQGHSPKDIAAQTGRSVHTVRTVAQHAAEKLGCSGRQQTIAVARARGLIA